MNRKYSWVLIAALVSMIFYLWSRPVSNHAADLVPEPPIEIENSTEFHFMSRAANGISYYTRALTDAEVELLSANSDNQRYISNESGPAFLMVAIRNNSVTLLEKEEIVNFMRRTWRTVDRGFLIDMPWLWVSDGADWHGDGYGGRFESPDFELSYVSTGNGEARREIETMLEQLKLKEKNPERLEPGEAIWRVNGRLALVVENEPIPVRRQTGRKRFIHVARITIPSADASSILAVTIQYKSEADLPVVRRVFTSIRLKE